MYSPSLGRFISADTVVPRAGDSQAFNRYAYARNSPLTRIDPSGHGDCNVHVQAGCHYANDVVPTAYNGNRYGISFSGLWSKWNADTILQSAQIIEKRLMQADISYASRIAHVAREAMSSLCAICNLNTEGAAWRAVMGSVTISFVAKQATYEGRPYGGEKVFGKNEIRYYPIAFSKNSSLLHNSLHEFGHLYSAHAGENRQPYVDIASAKIVVNGIQIAGGSIRSSYGYASEKGPFQQHPLDSGGEDIADMFMNWSLH